MATIELRLSNKIQKETGRAEVMIRFFHYRIDIYARSEVFINPEFFEYYIDRKKTVNPRKPVPANAITAPLSAAVKNGWSLRKSGIIIVSNRRIKNEEVRYHEKQAERIEQIKRLISTSFEATPQEMHDKKWLKKIIDKYNHPQKYLPKEEKKVSFYELVELYITKRKIVESHARVFRVLSRAVARYEGYVRATDKSRRSFTWDIDRITRDDIENLSDYLRNEKQIADMHPNIFKKLLSSYPAGVKKGKDMIQERGENTVIKMRTRLKSLFLFFVEVGFTKNHPFDGIKIGTAKVGTPYYISIEERNRIEETDLKKEWEKMEASERKAIKLPLQTIMIQRDIFVFHCLIGCRVGDLVKMTSKYIVDGILVYTPHKTKDDGEEGMQARVPLHPKALSLIKKYKGMDPKGRLFPFISAQKYNDAIKVIFRLAGITRNVEVRNPLTGENELRPINEIASSHLARRTFIGNAYFKVQDPNLIGKMSGHVEGSQAFARYRKIEDSTLKDIIKML